MRTRLQGAMATMLLIVGSLLVVAAPAAAGDVPADESAVVDDGEGTETPPVESLVEPASGDSGDEAGDAAPEGSNETGTSETDNADAADTGAGDELSTGEPTGEPAAAETNPEADPADTDEPTEPEVASSTEEAEGGEDAPAADESNAESDENDSNEDNTPERAEATEEAVVTLADVVAEVDVCVTDGLDWTLVTTDPQNAQWLVDNEGAQWPGTDGCLVRVCRVSVGTTFPAWYTDYATPSDADWILQQSSSAFVPDQGASCPTNELVTICRFKGLDYLEVDVDPHDANWLLANDQAMLPGESGCLVRVCRLKVGQFFTFWHSLQATPEDAEWILAQNQSAYLPKQGEPCPGNEPVTICELIGIDYKPQQFDPQTAEWLLKTNSDFIQKSPSGCLVRICVADGEPYDTWSTEYVEPAVAKSVSVEESLSYRPVWGEACPDNGTIRICDTDGEVIEVDPQAANEMVKGDGAVEPDEGECPTPEPEPTPEPTPEATPTPQPSPTPKEDPDEGEVLGESQSRQELAETGAESTRLALAGFVLIAAGLGLVGSSKLRRQPALISRDSAE